MGIACKSSGKTITSEELQMIFIVLSIAIFLPVASIFAAIALMRMFDVKDARAEQTQAEAEKLLAQVNREVKRRHHVRAGAPSNLTLTNVPRFASLSAIRMRFPSA